MTYGNEVWTWNESEQSKIQAVEMSYLRAASGRHRMERVGNREVYENFGMEEKAEGINCGVVEWVKRNTLRWYGHVRRMPEDRIAKKVFRSEATGVSGRGRLPITWEGRVELYSI